MNRRANRPDFIPTVLRTLERTVISLCRLPLFSLTIPLLVTLLVLTLCLPAAAESEDSSSGPEKQTIVFKNAKPLKIIYYDDQANPLRFPSSVFYENTNNELYVISANGRVIVYGPDYHPLTSLGKGRGLNQITGGYATQNGDLYVCQIGYREIPSRITVLNAAFFKKKEITFEDIKDKLKDDEEFQPRRIAIGRDGKMYVTGTHFLGVLVLDSNGHFLRRLMPKDTTQTPEKKSEFGSDDNLEIEPGEIALEAAVEAENTGLEETTAGKSEPVTINDVKIDNEGNIYMLSENTSKVYVYNQDEEFLYSFGQKGGSEGKMSRPKSLALDEKSKFVYICDYMRHTILIFDFKGNYIAEFGGKGWSPGWFQHPMGLATDSRGRLIVADLFNHRIQVLKPRFTIVSEKPGLTGRSREQFVKQFNRLYGNLAPGSSRALSGKKIKTAYINPESDTCLTCHNEQKDEFESSPSKHSDLSCIFCHPVHKEIPGCSKCHEPHKEDQVASDCVQCHPAHRPFEIASDETSPRSLCTPCHKAVGEEMDKTTTKHRNFTCAFCHKGAHPSLPSCDECHGTPHSAAMHKKMPDCLDCHLDNHNLAM
ncbi:MAG: 6-bladed beta-propeller [Thermodesulfobacteriota bacterium]|nr:6-bladed beta-propeller [Thermodesulfobacteriota bacterium]